ncbi:10457_t:CDS:1, partial [Scutellospora calospora]
MEYGYQHCEQYYKNRINKNMNSFLQRLEKRENKLIKEDRIEKLEVSEECIEEHKKYEEIQVIDSFIKFAK